jgi:nickel-dependent lactate racemase
VLPLDDQLRRALVEPVGCSPLSDRLQPGMRVLIVVDDVTRRTPVNRVLPILLEHLSDLGCRDGDIRLALALGTHRRMTSDEIRAKLGEGMLDRFHVANNSACESEFYVDAGESVGGVPLEVHRDVLGSDVVIGIGSVIPHMNAGWSGGAKVMLPGMSGERTIMENHMLAASFSENMLGLVMTEVRENMEAVAERVGLDYIINAVMSPDDEVVGMVGGHFVDAQRAAVEIARHVYCPPCRTRADVVVVNSFPAEIDFAQGIKGIWAGDRAVKPGGIVILNAPCREGLGSHTESIALLSRTREEILAGVKDGRTHDKIMAANVVQIARMLGHMRLAIVSEGLGLEADWCSPVAFFSSLQHAVDEAMALLGGDSKVSVITHGGYLCPIRGGR